MDRVAQAADILLNRWSTMTGRKHVAARKACLGVLEGIKETRDARKACVEAAKEVDILVERDPWG